MNYSFIFVFGFLVFVSCKDAEQKTSAPSVANEAKEISSVVVRSEKKKDIPQNGYYKEYYPSNLLKMEGMMKNGKREGIWKAWFEDGKLWSVAFYEKGVRQGESIVYREGGVKLYQGSYLNDKKIGKWLYYDESGKVASEVEMKE